MDEEQVAGFVKKIDVTYKNIRIELYIGEPYVNEANNICIPLLRRLYLLKSMPVKVSKTTPIQ